MPKMDAHEPETKPAVESPPHRTGPLPPPSVPPLRGISHSHGTTLLGIAAPAETSFDPLLHGAAPGFSPDRAVTDQLAALQNWAEANERDTVAGAVRFWLLKGPAFLCAVAASAAESFGQGRAVIVLGALAALAIAVDAAWSGPANSMHQRAIHDIRGLQNSIKLRWDKIRIMHPDAKDPARTAEALAILDTIQTKRDEIARYLGSPQTSPPAETTF
jgi:hypothetical protein